MIKKLMKTFCNTITFILFFISILCFLAVLRTTYIWGSIYFEQILIILHQGIIGTGKEVVNSYISLVFVPAVLLTCLLVFLINSNRKIILLSIFAIIVSLYQISFFEFLLNKASYTKIYNKNPKMFKIILCRSMWFKLFYWRKRWINQLR